MLNSNEKDFINNLMNEDLRQPLSYTYGKVTDFEKNIVTKYNKIVTEYNKVEKNHELAIKQNALPSDVPMKMLIHLMVLKIKKKFKNIIHTLSKRKYEKKTDVITKSTTKSTTKSITVVIPTYKETDLINLAIESVEKQDCSDVEIEILLCVNGNKEWADKLKKLYKNNEKIRVLFTCHNGQSAGRNLGIKNAKMKYITFLDDDDILAKGFISTCLEAFRGSINLVINGICDYDGEKINVDTYINRAINIRLKKNTLKKAPIAGLFSTVTSKVYITKKLQTTWNLFDESLMCTEDVMFWAHNYTYVNKVAIVEPTVENSYIRFLRENSLSRDLKDYADKRLQVISKLEPLLFSEGIKLDEKKLISRFIMAQQGLIYRIYDKMSAYERKQCREEINDYDGICVRKGDFSDHKAVAFCYNFPPFQDTSAYVAAKRLPEIDALEGLNFKWTAIASNKVDTDKLDYEFNRYYTGFFVSRIIDVPNGTNCKEGQIAYAKIAAYLAEEISPEVIYSRAMAVGSHYAAYIYKRRHPEVKWYAEFSDPSAIDGATMSPRDKDFHGEEALWGVYYKMCEKLAFYNADKIIFTNRNQQEFMLNHLDDADKIKGEMMIMKHPVINYKFTHLTPSKYAFDDSKINIVYFGRFYEHRGPEEFLKLLGNKNVMLHMFLLSSEDYKYLESDRVIINDQIGYFEMLNVLTKCDYAILNDLKSETGINIWRPSKLSDYLAAKCRIIAICEEGSPMSLETLDENVLKVKSIDDIHLQRLEKKCN